MVLCEVAALARHSCQHRLVRLSYNSQLQRTVVPIPSHPCSLALAGYALFGSETDSDVLKNLTAAAVQRYVPPAVAATIVYGIAAAFTFNLLVNFVLKVRAGLIWFTILESNAGQHLHPLTMLLDLGHAAAANLQLPSVCSPPPDASPIHPLSSITGVGGARKPGALQRCCNLAHCP